MMDAVTAIIVLIALTVKIAQLIVLRIVEIIVSLMDAIV